jgi:hypothetical protein
MPLPSATAVKAAQALYDRLDGQARAAKRAEAASRRQARELRRSMEELQRACAALGITLTTTQARRP